MDAKTRVLTALNHEEPDRVPLFELGIDSAPILEYYKGASLSTLVGLVKLFRILIPFGWRRFLGWGVKRKFLAKAIGKGIVKFMKNVGYDATVCPVALIYTKSAFPKIKGRDGLFYVDEYGRRHFFSKLESGGKQVDVAFYDGGHFDTDNPEESYEEWGLLDPDHSSRAASYEAAVKEAKDDIYVIPGIVGVLEGTWEPFGFPTFTKLLYKKPQFIEKVFRDRGDFAVALAENMLDLGAETILVFDDAGHKNGPFLSPKMYEKFVVPQLKRICDKVHSYDAKIILHSCGNLYKILDLIVGAGIDGLHPIEAGSGMDIFQIKEDYGERISLLGNVDPIQILTHGTPESVDAHVKDLIKGCAPGGGYFLASGHSITYSVPLENFLAMLEAHQKYSNYPIEL